MPVPPRSLFRLRAVLAASAAATTGAAGGLGLLAYLQARMTKGHPGEGTVGDHLDGHVGPEHARHRRIVWIGDSLAAGIGAIDADVSLPRLVAAHADHRTRLHVLAVPGATSTHVVERQLPAIEQLRHGLAQVGERIEAIGVSVGANDIAAFTSRRRLRRNLEAIIATAEGTPMVFLSIPQLGDAIRLPHPLRAFASARASWLDRAIQRTVARHDGVEYASVRRRPDWISRRHRPLFLSPDRFHPSGAGYAVWADRVADAFDRVLTPPSRALTDPTLELAAAP